MVMGCSFVLVFSLQWVWLPWCLWLVEWWWRWLSIGFYGGFFLILFSSVINIILDEVV